MYDCRNNIASELGGIAEISVERSRKIMQTNCALFVDENVISLGVAAASVSNEESSTSMVSSSCQPRKPVDDQCSRIYKRSEMAPSIVCHRYLIAASFIVLAISGAAVCGTGSYLVHQLHGTLAKAEWYGPPVLLLITGILNVLLGSYFWFVFDGKFNRPQLFMFIILVLLVAILEASAGIWAIIDHGKVDSSIFMILEKKFASIGKIDDRSSWNITEIKVKCCGFDDSPMSNFQGDESRGQNVITSSCCNSRSYNENRSKDAEDTCAIFNTIECRDIALHRYRSVLIYTFVVALCATLLQIIEIIGLRSYANRLLNKRQKRSIVSRVNQQHPRITCPTLQLGEQHVCEGCSVQYHE